MDIQIGMLFQNKTKDSCFYVVALSFYEHTPTLTRVTGLQMDNFGCAKQRSVNENSFRDMFPHAVMESFVETEEDK